MQRWRGFFEIAYRSRDGQIVEREVLENSADLVGGGEHAMLDSFFRAAAAPASFYIRLWRNSLAGGVSLPAHGHTIADLAGEVVGAAYAAAALARNNTDFPTLLQDGGHWQVSSKLLTFAPSSGVWSPFNIVTLVTSTGSAGPIIAYTKTQAQVALDFDTPGLQQAELTYHVKLS